MPTDPRVAIGFCGATSPGGAFTGFEPSMTGGVPTATLDADQIASYPYPPQGDLVSGSAPVQSLPLYTFTGPISTLPMPTFTNAAGKTVQASGNGWFNQNDNVPGPTLIPGCAYPPDAWDSWDAEIPASGCSGGANAAVFPTITPPPTRRST